VEVVTDAPHSMYWERPDLFNDAIRRFGEGGRGGLKAWHENG
jgi:pimeloyl-ACP methyl ester carboxylesterase